MADRIGYLVLAWLCATGVAYAAELRLPQDPQQSIRYWKPHVIAPQKDPQVALAQRIFQRLLRGWDSSQLEPDLYVVSSTTGPWAASLSDGSILMSREAISLCQQAGEAREPHLLAFVLSHELAHQRSDDLWHQRFIRMIGSGQGKGDKQQQWLADMQQQNSAARRDIEAQADHDGLILMSSVGYDPYAVIDSGNFYTQWVESIWGSHCHDNGDSAMQALCQQARERARRTRAQLALVADQSVVYQLGVQAFVAGDYPRARSYFKLFAREYTSQALLSAIATTYLAEALAIQERIQPLQGIKQPAFYYPLMLDADYRAKPVAGADAKRASPDVMLTSLRKQRHQKISRAVDYFEKAIRLEPTNRRNYLQLAFSYLLDGNTYMARGIIQGQYIPKFKPDGATALAMAMITAAEGRHKKATVMFDQLTRTMQQHLSQYPDVIVYSGYYNAAALAAFEADRAGQKRLWKNLARSANQQGRAALFQVALQQLKQGTNEKLVHNVKAIRIDGLRLGQKLAGQAVNARPVWVQGEALQVIRNKDGGRVLVDKDRRIQNLWTVSRKPDDPDMPDFTGDASRPLIALGMPDRQLYLASGEYLAYDRYGLGIQVLDGRVNGWFLYSPRQQ